MLTATITNTSGATLAAGSLPGMLSWVGSIANNATAVVVLSVSDLNKPVDLTSGFTLGELLQQMIQKGTITVTYVDLGATDRSTVSIAHAGEV